MRAAEATSQATCTWRTAAGRGVVGALLFWALFMVACYASSEAPQSAPGAAPESDLRPRVPPRNPNLNLNANVAGLAHGTHLFLRANGTVLPPVLQDGKVRVLSNVPKGTLFTVDVPVQPNGQVCTVQYGQGAVGPHTRDVSVRCVLRVNLANEMDASLTLGQALSTSADRTNPPDDWTAYLPAGKTYTTVDNITYVADYGNNRVLGYFPTPSITGMSAFFVLGQDDDFTTAITGSDANHLSGPNSVAGNGNRLMITDSGNNRVLLYNTLPYGQADADVVVGQADKTSNATACSARGLNNPTSAIFDANGIIIADSGNSRILVWLRVPTTDAAAADLVVGQADMVSCAANQGGSASGATLSGVLDIWTDGNQLLAADFNNHRVLGWVPFPTANGATATFAIGQPDVSTAGVNAVSATSLNDPMSLVADGNSLFISDQGAHRVLVYTPIPSASAAAAVFTLGQQNFTDATCNAGLGAPTIYTLCGPSGLSFLGPSLVVADTTNNRYQIYTSDPAPVGR